LTTIYPVLATLAAYLLGSLSFAVIVSRVMGLNDPRTFGSKNPGATNVLRSGSKPAAIATLLLDGVKGWLPVALVGWYGAPYGMEDGTIALVGLAAFLGHLYPVFFKFVAGLAAGGFCVPVFVTGLAGGIGLGSGGLRAGQRWRLVQRNPGAGVGLRDGRFAVLPPSRKHRAFAQWQGISPRQGQKARLI
jgi:glycerol-3-phosphate acyltransferase PlsY